MTQTKDWRYQRYFNNPNFGDGSDGNVSIIGPVTLTRDVYYNNLELTGPGVLNTRGFRVYVAGTLTLDATIHNDGTNAVTFTGGATPPAASVGIGGAGGNGNVLVGGSGGSGGTNALGGTGGNGGAGGGGAGGPAAPAGPLAASISDLHSVTQFGYGVSLGVLFTPYRGGGGGGGGGGNGVSRGGGGGGGGNVLLVAARRIILGPLGVLRSRGGNGAPGSAVNTGGGGAGGGGLIICSWEEGATEAAVLAICSVPPGTPGASGGGAGVAGVAGAIGRTRLWKMH